MIRKKEQIIFASNAINRPDHEYPLAVARQGLEGGLTDAEFLK
jgi:hypothetical protein